MKTLKGYCKLGLFSVLSFILMLLANNIFPDSKVHASDIEYAKRGTGTMGWHATQYGGSFTEERMKANVDWMAENFKDFGYEYIGIDGWINDATNHNENGYIVSYKKWKNDYAYWADYVHSKGLKLGVYYNPSWVLKSIANDESIKVVGTDYTIKSLVHPDDPSKSFQDWYMIDPNKPGAEEYVKGMVEFYKSIGADLLKVDFIRLFDDAYGAEATETFYRWMREAAGDDIILYYANQKNRNHAEAENKYADLIRASEDFRQDIWYHTSVRNRGQVRDNSWPPAYNLFDGLVWLSDISGTGKVALDGDYSVLSTSASDAEKKSRISLLAMAGSSINIGDNYQNIGLNDVYYKNWEIVDMNKQGFIGKPLVRDVKDPLSQIWKGQLPDGTWIVGLFNREETPQERAIDFSNDLGLSGEYLVSDMWSHSIIGTKSSYSEMIEPHGVRLLKISKLSMEPYGGFLTGPQTVKLQSIDPEAKIHYTMDGTEPDANSPQYTGQILIDKPTTLRAKIFQSDGQSYEASAMFVENKPHPLAEIVAGITSVPKQEKDAVSLTMPAVPDGFAIAIKSSDRPDVIQRSGAIHPPIVDTTVNLVFEIRRLSDGLSADTNRIAVDIPAGSPGNVRNTYDATLAKLNGSARLVSCARCSGGQKIGNIGNTPNNYAFFDVTVPAEGAYKLQLEYLTGNERSFFVGVNGEEGSPITLNGPDFNTPLMADMTVILQEGSNVIKIYNNTAYGPDLASISLHFIHPSSIAADIISVPTIEKGTTSLTMPAVPLGFTVAIKSSDHPDIIKTDGTINHPKKDTIVNLILEVTRTYDGEKADTEAISVLVPAGDITIQSMRDTLETYIQSGDLKGPLIKQLQNRLNQAEEYLDKGNQEQAAKKMEDFLKHLDNEPMQHFVSEEAKATLKSDAETLIALWLNL
ncbi:FIMAH domain-containing protein [Lederbergia citri]|uniref:Chitobiase/beta-hexosaminidase C-terminal domain-containing protein n=1 Tax=Lederbergia citri TaxID=2833580 RepID=A0A942TIW0_9BACI|nr:chitobiase/beta-hexosaminidase C-terminal domain-containing protein [Lederbergia citri]MBS4196897.1 chitobiase/beta-hexosaminidase C-terminal domain-containing protein [Lederbergia citri]